jgi:hypothetical protein
MKRETLRHPKTYDLAARLNCDRATALGLLVLLWDFTGDAAISGDVGKWNNGAIARACDFAGDADAFIEALVGAGWLDEVEEHRLVVHDWPDHCEDWVRKKMDRAKLQFCACYGVKDGSSVHKKHGTRGQKACVPTPECHRSANGVTILTEPNLTEPNRTEPKVTDGDGTGGDIFVSEEDWPEVRTECTRILKIVPIGKGGKTREDCELIYRMVALRRADVLSEEIYAGSIEAIKAEARKKCGVQKPAALLTTALHRRCKTAGMNLHELLRRVTISPWAKQSIDNLARSPPP